MKYNNIRFKDERKYENYVSKSVFSLYASS